MIPPHFSSIACAILLCAATVAPASAQQQDIPLDLNQLLTDLRASRQQQAVQSKARRESALRTVQAASSSAEQAVALWKNAVQAVQFDGMAKEGAEFREWNQKEGEGLEGQHARSAVRLCLMWLALTLQRDAGAQVKDLLPQVINYTKELSSDLHASDDLAKSIKKDQELNESKLHGKRRNTDDRLVKRMHDHILKQNLAASPVVKWLKIEDYVNPKGWETTPGNFDGIFTQIVLPELRAQRDPRLLEYWEMKMKKEAEVATTSQLSYEIDKFNQERRPELLWSRAEDMLVLGLKNRALSEMVAVIKANPRHARAEEWIGKVEQMLSPSASPAPSPTPAASS